MSTIWKQHITKRIARAARLWYEEQTHRIEDDHLNIGKWRYCPQCRRMLYAHDLNFAHTQDGGWKDICKQCGRDTKKRRDQRRKERGEME